MVKTPFELGEADGFAGERAPGLPTSDSSWAVRIYHRGWQSGAGKLAKLKACGTHRFPGQGRHKIVATHVLPPIPLRQFDWQAHYDGEEDEQMDTGSGKTELEAVVDLIENHPRPDVFCCDRPPVRCVPADPCTEEARDDGCTCTMQGVHSAMIDPPEPVLNATCPLHGWAPDPDEAYERARDDRHDQS